MSTFDVVDSTVLLYWAEVFCNRDEDYWSWYSLLWWAEIKTS